MARKLTGASDSNVPIAIGGESHDRPFAAIVLGAKAVLQFESSFSLTWVASVQREQSALNTRFVEIQYSSNGRKKMHITMFDTAQSRCIR